MNVLEEDRYMAAALSKCIDYCMGQALQENRKAQKSGISGHYRTSRKWLVECQRCQNDLEMLFLKKEESDNNTKIFGRVYR